MKHALTAGAAALLLAGAGAAQDIPAGEYTLDKNHASITWSLNHIGTSTYVARFNEFDAALTFDPENPENSSLSVTIDVTSLDLDYDPALAGGASFYDELMGNPTDANPEGDDRFFRAREFPTITFEATAIEVTGENTGTVTGDLTLLGATRPLTFDVTLNGSRPGYGVPGTVVGFSGVATVKRSEWGMGAMAPDIIGDDVLVRVEAEFFSG